MRIRAVAPLAVIVVGMVAGCGEQRAKVDMTMHMDSKEIVSGVTGTIAALTSYFFDAPPGTPATPGAPVPRGPGFATAASMVAPRGLHTATAMADGRVLIVGGLDTTSKGTLYVGACEVYDPVAKAFAKVGATPIDRVFHAAVLLADGRVLICGGYGPVGAGQADIASAFTFDPKTDSFDPVGPLGTARHGHRAVRLPNGKVLVAGGTSAKVEMFDPATNAFTAAGDLSAPREDAGMAYASGGALVVGGRAGMDVFVPASRTLVAGSAPSFVRAGATFDAIGVDDAILAGGRRADGTGVLEVERMTGGDWRVVAQLPEARSQHGAAPSGADVLLAGGIAVAAGGRVVTLATADYVAGATNVVRTFTMAHARNGCAVTALPSGELLVTGGFENGATSLYGLDGTSVAPAELFTKP